MVVLIHQTIGAVITGFLLSGCGEVQGSVTGMLSLETSTADRTWVQQMSFNPKRNQDILQNVTEE